MRETAGQLKRWARTMSEKTPVELGRLFGPWASLPRGFGAGERTRLFSPSRTFWLFLSQVLDERGCCREALRRFQAWLLAEGGKTISPSTAAYCKARAKLSADEIKAANRRVVRKIEKTCPWLWHGRRVMAVDGTGLSMPDTQANQAAWPQSKKTKPGCGFPVMRVCALFSMATGALAGLAHGSLDVHERTLYRKLWRLLKKGDVLLGDRGFCAFADFFLLSQRGVDCVMRKNGRRKNACVIKRIGRNDRIVRWDKSRLCPKWLPGRACLALPERLCVRELKVSVPYRGFRTQTIFVVTTLLDPKQYPAYSLADLYFRRWKAELSFRDIKTTMGMDVLRCLTPKMILTELWMHVIAYNLVRAVMTEAALQRGAPLDRISFKGTLSTLRQWACIMAHSGIDTSTLSDLFSHMLDCIARDKLPYRPGRTEPRARKRRPKNYQLLNKPRAQFSEIMHRSKYTLALS